MELNDKFSVKSEWFFEYEDGRIEGPFSNSMSTDGINLIAQLIEELLDVYVVVGDDTAAGFVITEVFRKAVSAVTRSDNIIRFRTQLLTSECVGTSHQKVCIFANATSTPGSGTMLNMLRQLWSKTSNTALTVECRITVQGGS